MVDRISTAALTTNTIRDVNNVSANLARQQRQISGGISALSYSELAGSVERVSGFEEKLGKIDNYIRSNSLISTRLNSTSTALGNVQTVLEEFNSNLALFNGVTEGNFDLEDTARSALQQIEDSLNISIGGRYLFSGSRTNTPPISDIEAPVNIHGVADANYYQGDSEQVKGRISDSFELEYGITADDPALQGLITGIRTALEGAAAGSESIIRDGQRLVEAAVTDLSALRAKVNLDITTVESANSQHLQLQTFWRQSLSAEIDTDTVTVTTEIDLNRTVLQASFQSWATLSQLKLTDYI